ncbi:MAG: MltA domain-containing protein [Candidatus Binatia bacterium]
MDRAASLVTRAARLSTSAALIAAVLAMGMAAGCTASRPPSLPLEDVVGADVDDLDPASLALAAERNAVALERGDVARRIVVAGRNFTAGELADSSRRVVAIARGEKDGAGLVRRLASECRAVAAGARAKVTAYYEPLLEARRRPDRRFRYPIYAQPSPAQLSGVRDRLGRVPTRADIDGGDALAGLGLEIAWVDDAVARFFLHVQGSGRLRFEDGSESRVGYAASNDLAYRSVGSVMLAQGLLEPGHASATAMRRWLAEHPERRDGLLFENPRYIFFRDTGGAGPIGALGATLVAGRSVATDDGFLPRGSLLWLRTTQPLVDEQGRMQGKRPLTRFVYAQDAGAAIQGEARLDLFLGSGEEAGLQAGGMNEAGEVYLLLCPARKASLGPLPPTPRMMPRTGRMR